MLDRLKADVRTAKANDPAATGTLAVLLTYPGLHAVWLHRVAHAAWDRGNTLTARLIAHFARFATGVEIHPGATLGDRVFIDHGMGTVIGETSVVGDDVQLYHGVTLGGKSSKPEKRHPTVCDGVTLGADSTLIGDITVGTEATVGAGAVVVDDVAPGTTVVGVPAEPVDETDEERDGEVSCDDVIAASPSD
jgi:serine O-acetyltransferase